VVLLVYVALSVWGGDALQRYIGERVMVLGLLALGFTGMILMAFLWNVVSEGGHSVALISLSVVAGVADSLSSVVFLPMLSHYDGGYAIPFSMGEACTSLVATLLAIVQDPAGADRFSVMLYFILIALVSVCSGLSYMYLATSKQWRKPAPSQQLAQTPAKRFVFMPRAISWDLAVTALLNFCENGIMVSLLTFCIRPYGDAFYKGALWGGMIAAPIGTVATFWFARGLPALWSLVWIPPCVLVVVNATVRPVIALGSTVYPVFLVIIIILTRFMLGFTKSLIYLRVLRAVHEQAKEGSMLLIGMAQQLGASVGSVLFFLLIFYGYID
jgi:hypothetical protein